MTDDIIARYKAIGDKNYVKDKILKNPVLKNPTLIDYVGFTKSRCANCAELTRLFYGYNLCGCPHCLRQMQTKQFDFMDIDYEEYLEEYVFTNRGCNQCLNQALAEFGDEPQTDTIQRDLDYSRSQKNKRKHIKTSSTPKRKSIPRKAKYRDVKIV